MRLASITPFLLFTLAVGKGVAAEEPPPRRVQSAPAFNPTHEGFYFSAKLGGGWVSSSDGDGRVSLSGAGGSTTLAFGGTFAADSIFFVEVSSQAAVAPKGQGDGSDVSIDVDTHVQMVGIGFGLAHYLMPANVFFSAALTVPRIRIAAFSGSHHTDFGLGGSFSAGKEWWVSEDWGLGVAGQFVLASADDGRSGWGGTALMLAFSATYN